MAAAANQRPPDEAAVEGGWLLLSLRPNKGCLPSPQATRPIRGRGVAPPVPTTVLSTPKQPSITSSDVQSATAGKDSSQTKPARRWCTLSPEQARGTVYATLADMRVSPEEVTRIVGKRERPAETQRGTSAAQSRRSSGRGAATPKAVNAVAADATQLEASRAQNLAIALRRVRCSPSSVVTMDVESAEQEEIEVLLRMLGGLSDEERAVITASTRAVPERRLAEFLVVPAVCARLRCLLWAKQRPTISEGADDAVAVVLEATRQIRSSATLKRVVAAALAVGRTIDGADASVGGMTLESIVRLSAWTGANGTAMDVVVEKAAVSRAAIHRELSQVAAARSSFTQPRESLKSMRDAVEMLQGEAGVSVPELGIGQTDDAAAFTVVPQTAGEAALDAAARGVVLRELAATRAAADALAARLALAESETTAIAKYFGGSNGDSLFQTLTVLMAEIERSKLAAP